MKSYFVIIGQVGYIKKLKNGCYSTTVYLNKYNESIKEWSLPINVISKFKPKPTTGNSVLVEGEFGPSEDGSLQFIAKHIGIL